MPRVIVIRGVVLRGRMREIGEEIEITDRELSLLGGASESVHAGYEHRRVRLWTEADAAPPAPDLEMAVEVTAESAAAAGRARTRRRNS